MSDSCICKEGFGLNLSCVVHGADAKWPVDTETKEAALDDGFENCDKHNAIAVWRAVSIPRKEDGG